MVAELKLEERRQTSVQYHCECCATDFCLIDRKVLCPNCESRDLSKMVIIYQEHDAELHSMYSKIDWRAGD